MTRMRMDWMADVCGCLAASAPVDSLTHYLATRLPTLLTDVTSRDATCVARFVLSATMLASVEHSGTAINDALLYACATALQQPSPGDGVRVLLAAVLALPRHGPLRHCDRAARNALLSAALRQPQLGSLSRQLFDICSTYHFVVFRISKFLTSRLF